MLVLALDLATKTGWACGSKEAPVTHGFFDVGKTGEDIGLFARRFRDLLTELVRKLSPTELVYESPILRKTTSLATARKLYGLATVTEMVAGDLALPVSEASLQEIREHFVGVTQAPRSIKGPGPRRKWIKDKVIAECTRRGFKAVGDDEADAIALLDFVLCSYDPQRAVRATPLFQNLP